MPPPGPLPKSLSNAAALTDLVMPYHQFTGELPALANGLYWLDLKGNRLSRLPGAPLLFWVWFLLRCVVSCALVVAWCCVVLVLWCASLLLPALAPSPLLTSLLWLSPLPSRPSPISSLGARSQAARRPAAARSVRQPRRRPPARPRRDAARVGQPHEQPPHGVAARELGRRGRVARRAEPLQQQPHGR